MNHCKNNWCMHEAGASGFCGNCEEPEANHHSRCLPTRLDIATPAPFLAFFGPDQKKVGSLDIRDGVLHFEGDADESARIFIASVGKHLNLPVQMS